MRWQKDEILMIAVCAGVIAGIWLMLGLLHGCMPAQHWTPVCRHYALVEASVAHEAGFPARVAVGEAMTTDGSTGQAHATGQAYISGEWMDMEYWHGYVIPSRSPELRTVERIYTLEMWAERMGR